MSDVTLVGGLAEYPTVRMAVEPIPLALGAVAVCGMFVGDRRVAGVAFVALALIAEAALLAPRYRWAGSPFLGWLLDTGPRVTCAIYLVAATVFVSDYVRRGSTT